jgi:hypothetical protein
MIDLLLTLALFDFLDSLRRSHLDADFMDRSWGRWHGISSTSLKAGSSSLQEPVACAADQAGLACAAYQRLVVVTVALRETQMPMAFFV